jgi:hypothetical protein
MTAKSQQDRALLLATARAVAQQLKVQSDGTRLRVRVPRGAAITNSDGCMAVIGDLGKNQPRLEVRLDRFSGYPAEGAVQGGYRCLSPTLRCPGGSACEARVFTHHWPPAVAQCRLRDAGPHPFLIKPQVAWGRDGVGPYTRTPGHYERRSIWSETARHFFATPRGHQAET